MNSNHRVFLADQSIRSRYLFESVQSIFEDIIHIDCDQYFDQDLEDLQLVIVDLYDPKMLHCRLIKELSSRANCQAYILAITYNWNNVKKKVAKDLGVHGFVDVEELSKDLAQLKLHREFT